MEKLNLIRLADVKAYIGFLDRGIATKLYMLLFDYLKSDGYKIVYSGKTRNSYYVDNLWSKFSDSFEILKDSFGTKKIYYKIL
jgi:hypothetical protein